MGSEKRPTRSRRDRAKHEGTEPHEAVKEAARPDPEGVGEAIGDALRPPDFRTRTSSPSTSERKLRPNELPDPGTSTQG
jgi:hypothetical protein